ncbi:hypothetical protein BCU68_13065 [Vibrio sp. 10N.286.49.B3]|uniref:diguanylate cyclase domain-containing protein n=1 Tax=Vibrio sp. 10N.286.49.B3 TaxID=1880855 RepID=UPI000C855595|nr:diguanylate cyclase [Vibrio sp. 10N.286.49.B3]PMH43775.1 hypothetical protein BCU68_13065 [Vibrio sp. 10N.286.49.B3]
MNKSYLCIKTIIALILGISIVVSFSTAKHINNEHEQINVRANEGNWFMFQLIKEYAGFYMLSQKDPINFDELNLAYDLTWSRFDIILHSEESKNFIQLSDFESYFTGLFMEHQTLEMPIKMVESGGLAKENLIKKIELTYLDLWLFVRDNFRVQNPLVEKHNHKHEKMVLILNLSFVICLVCIFLLWITFYLEYRHNKNQVLKDELTGLGTRFGLISQFETSSMDRDKFDLISIKLKNISEINLKYGIEYGDMVLATYVNDLILSMPVHVDGYRFSSRQFVLILEKGTLEHVTVERIKKKTSDVFSVGNIELLVDANVIFRYSTTAEQVLRYLHEM